ncbi:MAG: transcription elongation factor GreA [bacterium]|nr:transcription elongation factor GreA [bacterium]
MTIKYITKEGESKLLEELEYLKNSKRKELAERLQKAISFGDLSENFDYSNTKEEQGMVEGRIAEIEYLLKSAEVVEQTSQSDKVAIGSTVMLDQDGESSTFTITGPQEANPLEGKLSAESPLGMALIGKRKGEKVQAETPGGRVEYMVKDIS